MVGGAGDDVYYVMHPEDQVIELPGEGMDTVVTDVSHTLAPNVENLRVLGPALNPVGEGPPTLVGNALDNHIVGAPFSYERIYGLDGDDILDGGGRHGAYLDGGNGNDRLINSFGESRGGPGADTFVAAGRGGHTAPTAPITILDFNPAEGDRIEIWASQDHDSRALFAGGFLRFEADEHRLVYTTDPEAYASAPWVVEQIILLPGILGFDPDWVRVLRP
jgi:Ca2+-binding RTX toxin-like protein